MAREAEARARPRRPFPGPAGPRSRWWRRCPSGPSVKPPSRRQPRPTSIRAPIFSATCRPGKSSTLLHQPAGGAHLRHQAHRAPGPPLQGQEALRTRARVLDPVLLGVRDHGAAHAQRRRRPRRPACARPAVGRPAARLRPRSRRCRWGAARARPARRSIPPARGDDDQRAPSSRPPRPEPAGAVQGTGWPSASSATKASSSRVKRGTVVVGEAGDAGARCR